MSAEVETMFSANGIRPWHGIGKVLDDCPTSEAALAASGIDWTVSRRAAFAMDSKGDMYPAEGCFIARDDTNVPLGYVGTKYVPYQNKDLFKFGDDIIKNSQGIEAHYESAGALFGGKKVFLLIHLPDSHLVGDTVNNYLFISNAHDGKESLVAGITNVRVVCNNTLQMAMHSSERLWRLRHYATIEGRQVEATRALGLAVQYNNQLEKVALDMSKAKLAASDEEKFFRKLFEKQSCTEDHKEELIVNIKDLYENKSDLQNFRGTKWGMYNAVADYVSHRSSQNSVGEWAGHSKMDRFMFGETLLTQAEALLVA